MPAAWPPHSCAGPTLRVPSPHQSWAGEDPREQDDAAHGLTSPLPGLASPLRSQAPIWELGVLLGAPGLCRCPPSTPPDFVL